MRLMRLLFTALVLAGMAAAQSPESADSGADSMASMPLKTWPKDWDDKHILHIIPNYGTVEEPSRGYEPLTAREKFNLAAHDSFDPYNWAITGLYAGVYQKENEYAFGQGAQGYAKRYAVTFADATISTYISEGLFPTILHEDPRFFRLGEGTKWHRAAYALTRVLVTKTDSGAWRFNNSEIEGNLLAAGVSNFYYPPVNRGVGETFMKFGIGVVSDAGFNVLKEFWPDMRHKVLHK